LKRNNGAKKLANNEIHTPGKVYWLWRALMALSASSEVAYLTKQQPVNEK
jgi:hypothetical protein